MVSDGLNVTKTAVDGTYSLPGHSKVEFLFITTPSGYQTNYKHYYRVTNDREGYDFGVFPLHSAVIASDSSHSFVHISDTEISSKEGQNVWLANVRDYAINEKAAFIIHTGDLCYEAGMKAHLPMMNSENMGVPVFYCIGNHEDVYKRQACPRLGNRRSYDEVCQNTRAIHWSSIRNRETSNNGLCIGSRSFKTDC